MTFKSNYMHYYDLLMYNRIIIWKVLAVGFRRINAVKYFTLLC